MQALNVFQQPNSAPFLPPTHQTHSYSTESPCRPLQPPSSTPLPIALHQTRALTQPAPLIFLTARRRLGLEL